MRFFALGAKWGMPGQGRVYSVANAWLGGKPPLSHELGQGDTPDL